MKKYALIVAGGSGRRMQTDVPKQFLILGDKPVLYHTILAFYHHSAEVEIIVVLPESQITRWSAICRQYDIRVAHQVVIGGDTRCESVKNGLRQIKAGGLVAIHDGVRPLVSNKIITTGYQQAQHHGSAITVVPLKDSLREITDSGSRTIDRDSYRLVQTPQTFQVDLIKQAYEQLKSNELTDDASVAERAGAALVLVAGDFSNIKITTPEDLIIAQALLSGS
jgi:2-C-methyl-D-erythritol 4-phosphate cytidylyltransferase